VERDALDPALQRAQAHVDKVGREAAELLLVGQRGDDGAEHERVDGDCRHGEREYPGAMGVGQGHGVHRQER
jgi:hypothetical protein